VADLALRHLQQGGGKLVFSKDELLSRLS